MSGAIEGAERASANLQEFLRPHQRHDFVAALPEQDASESTLTIRKNAKDSKSWSGFRL
jgi:hypothetical protein